MSNPRIIKSLTETQENKPIIETMAPKDLPVEDGTAQLFFKIEIISNYAKKPEGPESKDKSPRSIKK